MRLLHTLTLFLSFLLYVGNLYAQETINTAGGLATGAGGSISYSIGQTVYKTVEGPDGSVSPGFQQPYEIITSIGIDNPSIHLNLKAYPNPTTDVLTLTAENHVGVAYQLLDAQGKLLTHQKLSGEVAIIDMKVLPSGGYLLKVQHHHQLVKAFTILKK